MERPGVTQVTTAEAREIRGAFRDLYVTLREVFAPPYLELRRRDPETGEPFTVVTFQPATLRLPDRQERIAGRNAGRVEAINSGTLAVEADLEIHRDDWFDVDGRRAVVTDVAPVVNGIGYRDVDFRVEG